MEKENFKYPSVRTWQKAPKELGNAKLQTGEMTLVKKGGVWYILAFCNGLKIHPLVENAMLPDYILVESATYPPIHEWGSAPKEFQWLDQSLENGDYTVQESGDLTIYIIAKVQGKLKAHLRMRFGEMPTTYRLLRREKYPPLSDWRMYRNQKLPLRIGEYTLVVNPRTGVPIRIIAWYNGCLVSHPYTDYAQFNENLRFVQLEEVKKR